MLHSLKKQLSVFDLRLLIATSDTPTMKNIFAYLEPMGYQLDSAASSDEVRNCLKTSSYDALILDSQLSDQNGIPLYTCLRMEHLASPIILLTPDTTMENLPRYLNSGADDIVISPLHLLELEARVLASIRLSKAHLVSSKLSWAGIELDSHAHTVTCDGKNLHLPPMAFTLLARLMKSAPNVVTRSELQNELSGDTPPSSDAPSGKGKQAHSENGTPGRVPSGAHALAFCVVWKRATDTFSLALPCFLTICLRYALLCRPAGSFGRKSFRVCGEGRLRLLHIKGMRLLLRAWMNRSHDVPPAGCGYPPRAFLIVCREHSHEREDSRLFVSE